MALLFLGAEHLSNQDEGDDGRGKQDEEEEDGDVGEADAGRWGGGYNVVRGTLTSRLRASVTLTYSADTARLYLCVYPKLTLSLGFLT